MVFRDIYGILPAAFRKRGVGVALSIFLRAVLDFAGVAVLVPVLAGLLEKREDPMSVLPVALGALGFIVLKGVAVTFLTKFRSRYVFSLYSELSGQVLERFLRKGLLFIRQSDSVDLANKVNAVTMVFASGVILALLNIMSALILLTIILAALFVYDAVSTLLLMTVIGPLMVGFSCLIRRRMWYLGAVEYTARKKQVRSVFDLFRGYADYSVNDAFVYQIERFDTSVKSVGNVRLRTESWSAVSSGFMETAVILSIIILMLMSFSSSWEISMTFGVFALSALKILPAVRTVVSGWQSVQSSEYSMDILKEILSDSGAASYPVSEDCREPLIFSDEISLRNVSFRYPGSDRYIFKSLDLTVRKGEYVGIRGSSGIGKTTLFNIMMGFYFPEEGGVYIDGEKLTPDNVRSWQRQIGYVPQDIFLVNGTFVENIAFGVSPENVDRDRIDGILERVGLKQWTDSMPQGIDTQIAEAGNTVSGGQKQRLGIARALYKGASVLFFDEATSSVDAAAENEINAFIRELSAADGDLTVIVIAHRQETLDSCKRIIDIEKLPLRSRTRSATSPRRGG